MTTQIVRCPICGGSDTAKGQAEKRELMRNHLMASHPGEWEYYQKARKQIYALEAQIRQIKQETVAAVGLSPL